MDPKVQEPLRYSGHRTYLDERLAGLPLIRGARFKCVRSWGKKVKWKMIFCCCFMKFQWTKMSKVSNCTIVSYHVILAICKIYTLSVIVGLLISWAPFLLLRVHCCINFFLKRKKERKEKLVLLLSFRCVKRERTKLNDTWKQRQV